MNTLTWVLVGFLAFWLAAALLRARGLVPDSVRVYGPMVSLHTKRGRQFLERVATPRRAWRAWGNFGLGVTLVVMVGSLVALVFTAWTVVRSPPAQASPLSQPRNALVIPGVNDFLPLAVAPEILFGLAVGLVVHEGGHGILCRVEDIDIKSMGLVFLTVIPAGAFVEPDEESQEAADRGARCRMFAAGVTNNFAVAIVAFVLLFGPVVGAIGVVSGATVGGALPGSPANQAGIDRGDVITGVENRTVTSNADLDRALGDIEDDTVTVQRRSGDPVTVTRSVLVTGAVEGGPLSLSPNTTITAVNGSQVNTTAAFYGALEDRPVATLTTTDGTTHTAPMGAYVAVAEDGPLSAAGAPEERAVVTRIDGVRTVRLDDLQSLLDNRSPGTTVPVTLYVDGERRSYDVRLGNQSGDGYLGVFLLGAGVSGVTVDDFGVEEYPAGNYLGVLGGDCPECPDLGDVPFGQRLYLIFTLPLIGIAGVPGLPYNFAGFVGPIANFFVVSGPLATFGPAFAFLLANALFWTAWVNVNLAFFNCIPTFLLDGGHILRASIESVVARLPVENGNRVALGAAIAVQVVMLGSLLVLLFGPQLLN
jgi:membrane-associated protease RseP (regulator of RpoE activity)